MPGGGTPDPGARVSDLETLLSLSELSTPLGYAVPSSWPTLWPVTCLFPALFLLDARK